MLTKMAFMLVCASTCLQEEFRDNSPQRMTETSAVSFTHASPTSLLLASLRQSYTQMASSQGQAVLKREETEDDDEEEAGCCPEEASG